jgi:hypothetical protein
LKELAAKYIWSFMVREGDRGQRARRTRDRLRRDLTVVGSDIMTMAVKLCLAPLVRKARQVIRGAQVWLAGAEGVCESILLITSKQEF